MFYPSLTRRDAYKKKSNGESYSSYSVYKEEVLSDCQMRCIYCDATLKEIGGEGLVLDHFRPKKHFAALIFDPRNLVSACSFCNRYKSSHWPSTTDDSHDNQLGFIDPFLENKGAYFSVDEQGKVIGESKPAQYEISLLRLNRNSRVLLRRKRVLLNDIRDFVSYLDPLKIDQDDFSYILSKITRILQD